MSKRKIAVLQNDEAWNDYLREAFVDTFSTPEFARTPAEGLNLIRPSNLDIAFVNTALLTKPLIAALQTHQTSNANFRAFALGKCPQAFSFHFDQVFEEIPPSLHDFEKKLVPHLPLPKKIHVLLVDDNKEVAEMFCDYFDHRTNPTVILDVAEDGEEGEKKIDETMPDILILDLKMPKKKGNEVYRDLSKKKRLPPTIIFIDAIDSEEILEIRRWGSPAFIEKGAPSSTMPAMAALIKKIVYFSPVFREGKGSFQEIVDSH